MKYLLDCEEYIHINGDIQNIRIRSTNTENPVMLFLHGGPGVCNRHLVMKYNTPLAERFTMVCWDQRASGKSFRKEQLNEKLNTGMYVADAAETVKYLCEKFNKEKIVIIGHSWGSYLGLRLSHQYPDIIKAYVGVGQLINGAENERIGYEFCVREAKKANDKRALKKLGNSPVGGVYESHSAMIAQRNCVAKYRGLDYSNRGGMIKTTLLPLLKSGEYNLSDIIKYAKGGMYTSDVLWEDVVSCEFDKTITSLRMPVLITQGIHDYTTPYEIAEKWFDTLEAPEKKFVDFENSAHSPNYEEAEKWNKTVSKFILDNL